MWQVWQVVAGVTSVDKPFSTVEHNLSVYTRRAVTDTQMGDPRGIEPLTA